MSFEGVVDGANGESVSIEPQSGQIGIWCGDSASKEVIACFEGADEARGEEGGREALPEMLSAMRWSWAAKEEGNVLFSDVMPRIEEKLRYLRFCNIWAPTGQGSSSIPKKRPKRPSNGRLMPTEGIYTYSHASSSTVNIVP